MIGGKAPAGRLLLRADHPDVPGDSPAAREEMFGPAAAIIPFGSLDEAVAIANDTEYGLGASIWTTDVEGAAGLAEESRLARSSSTTS